MLKIQPENKGGNRVKPGKRLYLTADGSKLVEAGPEAATLYCSEHATVPKDEFERLAGKPKPKRKKRSTKGAADG